MWNIGHNNGDICRVKWRFLISVFGSLMLMNWAMAQNTIWFQGFENALPSCTDNWSYTGGTRNSQTDRTGSWSGMVGRSGFSNAMTFSDVDVSGLANLNLQLYHSVRCGSGPGLDTREGAAIFYRLNGGPWQVLAQIGGIDDHCYGWAAAQGGQNYGSTGCNIYQAPNPVNYVIPAGTNTIGLRIVSVRSGSCSGYNSAMNAGTAGNYDRTDEGFHIDDVRITTSSTDFNSIWTGIVSTDWHNCLNWNNGIVPNATSNVFINQSGVVANNCTVLNADATCNILTLTSANSFTQGLVVTNNRTLSVLGNMIVSRTANGFNTMTAAATNGGAIEVSGDLMANISPPILFNASILLLADNGGEWNVVGNVFLENSALFANPRVGIALNGLVASEFRCLNLSMIGNPLDINGCYFLMQSNQNHVLEVRGDFLMLNNARFNLGAFNNPQVLFGGDVSNQVSAAQFLTNNSQVVFNGNGVQEISTSGFTLPFHNLSFNKAGGHVRLNNDITLSNSGVLALNNDYLELNTNELFINNSTSGAITRINGAITDESGSGGGINEGRINWTIGAGAGSFIFPFSRGVGGPYIPFVFNRISGNAGTVSLSTYGTPPNNQPWPLFPDPVLNLNSTTGLIPDNQQATVDRFWQIDVSGAPTANLTFHYVPDELPAAPFNIPASLRAQRYDTTFDIWLPATITQIAGPNSVEAQNISTFSPWTLASDLSPLPLDWLAFTATPFPRRVELQWVTTNQVNTSHFEIQRSDNALQFKSIGTLPAAGFASYPISYPFVDKNPLNGISYYRIKQIDFDGAYSFSDVRAVSRMSQSGVAIHYQADGCYIELCADAAPVELFNTLGQTIEVHPINGRLFIPYGNYPPGIYLLHNACENSEKVTKIFLR